MRKYRHKILGFLVEAGRFPNGYEDGYVLRRRGAGSFPARLPKKYWRDGLIDEYEILGYWIRIGKEIFDVWHEDYLVIRKNVYWLEKEFVFFNNYEEV